MERGWSFGTMAHKVEIRAMQMRPEISPKEF
jgi:hypothetical protein